MTKQQHRAFQGKYLFPLPPCAALPLGENRRVNYPIAKARGLQLGRFTPSPSGSVVYACSLRFPRIPYPVCIGRLIDCTEWGSPTRQRTRGTHYLPGRAASASRCCPRWVRSSRLLRVIGSVNHKREETALPPHA